MPGRMKSGRQIVAVSARTASILNGEEDLSVWDDEELLRGQRRSKNGNFVGRPPKVVPNAVHQERVRRTMSKAHEVLRTSTVDAVRLLRKVVRDPEATDSDRIRAAELILNRVLGKAPDRVELALAKDEEPPWLRALREATVIGDDDPIIDPDDPIIDADSEEVVFE